MGGGLIGSGNSDDNNPPFGPLPFDTSESKRVPISWTGSPDRVEVVFNVTACTHQFCDVSQGQVINEGNADDNTARADLFLLGVQNLPFNADINPLGVTIESSDRGMVDVTGRSPEEIGVIARDHGIALTSLVPERRSLEDVFMELTADAVEYHGTGAAAPSSTPIAA